MKFTAVGNVIRHSGSRAGISRIWWDNAGFDPANPEVPGEDVTKTSIQLGFTYNFDLPGYTITRQTARIDGEEHQILVFSWLDEQGEPIHQLVSISYTNEASQKGLVGACYEI